MVEKLMKKIRGFLFFLIGIVCFCFNAYAQVPTADVSPENWLMKKGKELFSILSEEDMKTRYLKLRRIAKEVFHQQEMTRLAMGRYWRDLSADQQSALQYLFFDYFVVSYGTASLGGRDIDIKVVEKQPSGRDILLKTHVNINFNDVFTDGGAAGSSQKQTAENKNFFEILFALRETSSGYYIRDAKFEGQSILMFLRSRMEQEMQSAEYEPEKFLNALRKKIDQRYRIAEDLARAKAEKQRKKQQ